jgi:tetratricopeptide (TPR) repeat protein
MQKLPASADAPAVRGGKDPVKVVPKADGDHLTLEFAFPVATPAAVFRRGDMLWFVVDGEMTFDLAAFDRQPSNMVRGVAQMRARNVSAVRLKLDRPMLVSAALEKTAWRVTVGTETTEPTRPLGMTRNVFATGRSSITIPFEGPRSLHRITDPEAGDSLLVVTALGPARGFVKGQEFIEFRALTSTHGVIVQPLADDVAAELADDKIILTRPTGLTLSAMRDDTQQSGQYQPQVLDAQLWGFDRQADFVARKADLIRAAAEAPELKRRGARIDLARFYLARDMAAEAKAVLDLTIAEHPPSGEDITPLVLRAIAAILIGRPEQALKDLAHPAVGNLHDAPLWRALAHARQGKWSEARAGFGQVEAALATLPIELQRTALKEMARAALEVGDITGAVNQLQEFETIGIPRELEPSVAVLNGRVAEALGRPQDALRAYRSAADSWERRAAAQGRLREIVLLSSLGEQKRLESIADLETLTTVWRGDETEAEGLQLLARLYTEEGRFRDAFRTMRTALAVHPNSEMTRRIQDAAVATFDSLFLAGKGDALPAIDALSLFYDYRELTPIGRRGDEMIRRLADRLVTVDLLYQATELLQYQVDHRLQGVARAQVAARLAVIYLMDRKADRALATLRGTRVADLTNELRRQRLLLEARALSDVGRHEVALEVVANIEGREAARLRSDILWAAKRWREAAEEIERLHGERWRDFTPLGDAERTDILRAAIGYALGDDALGLARFRERYAGKMGEGPDHRAFDVVTAPIGSGGAEFGEIAKGIAAVDTLEAFLRDLRARYPETGAMPSAPVAATPPQAQNPRAAPPQTDNAT